MRQLFSLIILFFCLNNGYAQQVSGIITNSVTNEPIPFANVWIKGTTKGVSTDIDGYFLLDANILGLLYVSSIGYCKDSIQLNGIKSKFSISLKPNVNELTEVQVVPNYSYDKKLFKKVLKRRRANMKKVFSIKEYQQSDKTMVLLSTDSTSKLFNSTALGNYNIAVNENSKCNMLPVYISSDSNNISYDRKHRNSEKISSEKEGIFPMLNQQIESVVLNKIAIDFNFYNNQVIILERGFKSPLNKKAFLYYSIYLSDSITTENNKFYKFSFYPKNKNSIVFRGYMWVEDKSFALTYIEAQLSEKANLNFINNLNVVVSYKKLDSDIWFYDSQNVDMRFSLLKSNIDSSSLSGNVNLSGGELFIYSKTKYSQNVSSVSAYNNTFIPKKQLNISPMLEKQAIENIGKIKNNSFIKGVDKLGGMFLTGYYSGNKVDFGPIFDVFSTNYIEGKRFTLPLRTNKSFHENFSFGAYVGYGTKSKKIKYGSHINIGLDKANNSTISLSYSDDYISVSNKKFMQFIKENPYSKGDGNFISALTSKYPNPYILEQRKIEATFSSQINKSIGFFISPYRCYNKSTEFVPFGKDDQVSNYKNNGLLLNFRFSFRQDYDQLYFSKIFYNNLKPIINLSFDLGEIFVSGIEQPISSPYLHTHISIKNRLNIGISYIKLMANAGYIYGDVPYTMLEIPSGTQSLGYSRYNYNLLNHAAFAHNAYVNLHFNFNGGGVLFNHIPLISKLHLREVISLKSYYGMLSSRYNPIFDIPKAFTNKMDLPYAELGIGITNIFKVLRIEYVHRLNTNSSAKKYSVKHGIRMRFEIAF